MKKIICLLFALILTTASVFAMPGKTEDYYVNDSASVLSPETEKMIIEKNVDLYQRTGAQIVVCTVDFLDGMEIGDYAYQLFNNLEIGSGGNNNGFLLLLAIGEDNYYGLQGKGLEETLTGGDIDDILYDYLESDFAKKDYDAGVISTFDKLYEEIDSITTSGGVTDYREEESGSFSFFSILIAIAIVVVLVVLFSAGSSSGGSGGGGGGYRRRMRPVVVVRSPRFGGFGGFGGGFGGGLGGGSSKGGGFGGGGGFSGGGFGGGGGSSRGGGAGRR